MNSSTSDVLWPSPIAAHEVALHIAESQPSLMGYLTQNMITAILMGLFTASLDVTGMLSQDVQYALALLNQSGYSAHMVGNLLTVSW